MSAEKVIRISNISERVQYLGASNNMGRFLKSPAVSDVVRGFGSILVNKHDTNDFNVVPPIRTENLENLGQALVELAQKMDPEPPAPRYEINNG